MKTQIIVLHRYAYSDSSWIVKALSPDLGILSLLVKGAKAKNSPFRAGIDPLAYSEIEIRYNKHKASSLIIPKEVCLRNYFPKMRSNLQNLALAQFMAEIMLKLGRDESHAAAEFKWLLNNLEYLELHSVKENSLSLWLQKLCDILGYAPMLSKCGQCERELLHGPADLWPALGGAICSDCLGARESSYDSLFLQELGSFAKGKNDLQQGSWQRIESFFVGHLRAHAGTLENLRSWDWVLETRRLAC
ncbi:MAG: DNA repair protein RecO [Fibromonadaceae bacterium]|jgi:DNA repair protein RecO (recombination protein O)|nr:DNA repair protein RecO [Fibromonadaceae bacterium]